MNVHAIHEKQQNELREIMERQLLADEILFQNHDEKTTLEPHYGFKRAMPKENLYDKYYGNPDNQKELTLRKKPKK